MMKKRLQTKQTITHTHHVLLSISIVTYNSKYIQSTIDSIKKTITEFDYEIILVDNHSSSAYVKKLKQLCLKEKPVHLKRIILLNNKKNLGFGKAHNLAAAYAEGKYLLILNPDILLQKKTIATLLGHLQQHAETGVVSCRLLDVDGSLQHSCRRFPSFLTFAARELSFIPYFRSLLNRYEMRDAKHDKLMKVDWLSGALLLLPKKVFVHYRGFDDRFFLYLEDVDLCKRIRVDKSVMYLPEVFALHKGSYGSRRSFWQFYQHARSAVIYLWKHGF